MAEEIISRKMMAIPVPVVAPLGWEVDDPKVVQEVWDTFVKPEQEAGTPQSGEMRVLMAILRAVYEGLSEDV
jgi:hypothetical protein